MYLFKTCRQCPFWILALLFQKRSSIILLDSLIHCQPLLKFDQAHIMCLKSPQSVLTSVSCSRSVLPCSQVEFPFTLFDDEIDFVTLKSEASIILLGRRLVSKKVKPSFTTMRIHPTLLGLNLVCVGKSRVLDMQTFLETNFNYKDGSHCSCYLAHCTKCMMTYHGFPTYAGYIWNVMLICMLLHRQKWK